MELNTMKNRERIRSHQQQHRFHSRDTSPAILVRGRNFNQPNNNNHHHHQIQNGNVISGSGYRKTSAEIVSEARNLLAGGNGGSPVSATGGGARLVSTRRPITPRDPRRQLYGLKAPAGRPPSAFSLSYLQFESSRALPSLEPIHQQQQIGSDEMPTVRRTGSIGTLLDHANIANCNNNNSGIGLTPPGSSGGGGRCQRKLPALLSLPKITASLENLRDSSEKSTIMPTTNNVWRKLNHQRRQSDHINYNNNTNLDLSGISSSSSSSTTRKVSVNFEHPLRSRQTKSFDMPLKLNESDGTRMPTTSITAADTNPIAYQLGVNNCKIDLLTTNTKKDVTNLTPTTPVNISNTDANIKTIQFSENASDIDTTTTMMMGGNGNGAGIGIGNVDNHLQSKRLLNRSNDLMAQSTTETLLELLKDHAGIKECNEETVQHINAILVELYSRVKSTAKGNWRGAILGGLYGLVECTSGKILLAVARVVLALGVTGSNLTGACKLVFKVARNEANDYLFVDIDVPELLIDGLGRASPLDDPEACIYGYGAVRFLVNSTQQNMNQLINSSVTAAPTTTTTTTATTTVQLQKSIGHRLARHGSVQLMVLHLQILNEAGALQPLSGPPLHALYQLAAALRALAGIQQTGKIIGDHHLHQQHQQHQQNSSEFMRPCSFDIKENDINLELACPHLVKAAEISLGELEIQANIVRTLSVLSEHESCCMALCEYSGRIGMLLGPCTNNNSSKKTITNNDNGIPGKPLVLLSRLGYILGNIMARFDNARVQFFQNDVAMEYLIESLDIYSRQKFTIHNQMGDTVVDVLIKLVRVIANMSVNQDVGFGLGTRPLLGKILLTLLMTTNKIRSLNLTPEIEELIQAVLGALHNLCFYHEQTEQNQFNSESFEVDYGSMSDFIPQFSKELCDTLRFGPEKVRAEVARVLGNMTRNSLARNAFCSSGGLTAIVKCLDSEDYELRATCAGVLVNLLGDWERRAPFTELRGPFVLRDILQKSGEQEDWILAGIVCQALWNFLIDSGNVIGALGANEADQISEQLAEFLDEESLFKGEQPDLLWEQFATVATDLLERIQISLSLENSPCTTDDEDEKDVRIKSIGADNDDGLMDGGRWNGKGGPFNDWLNE